MKTRRTKVLLSLLAIMATGFAVTNAYTFTVENRNPFGVLNLSTLIIKPDANSTETMVLSDHILHIKTNQGKLYVHEICDEDGEHCRDTSSITNGGSISISGNESEFCYLGANEVITCDNTNLTTAITTVISGMNLVTPSDSLISIYQGGIRKGAFTLNQNEPGEIRLDAGGVGGEGLNVNGQFGKRCRYMCSMVDTGNGLTEITLEVANSLLQGLGRTEILGYSGCYVSCTENEPSEWDRIAGTNTIIPKGTDTNMTVNGNARINPGNNTTIFKNIPEVIINSTGVKMFGGINFYRMTSDNRRMRGLSVNGPILAGTSGNYIYMNANGTSSGDEYRSYEILGNNELAVGTRAGAFIYFTQKTGSYASVITGGHLTGTNFVVTGITIPVNICLNDLGEIQLPGASGGRGECTVNNVTVQSGHFWHNIEPPLEVEYEDAYKSLMVGVNTDAPNATLDVNGSIRVGSNCLPINLTCDENSQGTMMYLVHKDTYYGSLVICIADGLRSQTSNTISYVWYDIMQGRKDTTLEGLGFNPEDETCALPKPNAQVYPMPIYEGPADE